MNIKSIIHTITDIEYHNELIKMLANSVNLSTFILYVFVALAFSFIIEPFIPFSLLLTWFSVNFFVLGLRLYLGKKLLHATNNEENEQKIRYLKDYILLAALSGFIWGSTAFLAFLYAPSIYLFLTLTLIIGFSSGAVISLSSVFHAYAYFFILALTPIFVLLLITADALHVGTALGLIVYFVVVLAGAYKYYTYIKTTILLKDELSTINHSLEGEIVETLDKLKNKHYIDSQTQLPNRNKLVEVFSEQTSSSFLLIDIIKFKNVNDLYGVDIADALLKEFALYVQQQINIDNFALYRLSGDEFVVLNISNEEQNLELLASSLKENIHKNRFIVTKDNLTIYVDVIISIVNDESHLQLSKADMALNYAKENKLTGVCYSKELQLEYHYENDTKWTQIIKEAIEDDLVIPVFQPIIDRDGIKKYECLMRIIHNNKIITPFYFLDIAKKTHYYHTLTKIMIEKSFKVFSQRSNDFSINISFEDISNPEIVDFLMSKIDEYKIANQLIIEIVESESIDNFKKVHHFIQRLKERKVKIAIDDFGSGYSNFSYLLEFEPDFIKIDGTLIRNLDSDEKALIIVDVITDFSNRLGIKVIAEFVHCEAVYTKLLDLKIDYFQGYYFAEPLIENELD